ncbi:MAG TPA: zinc ribbon domain-containing protein [Thermoplasmata archaeon]|nr:zinc ribbon domain-containing protein [Thermoplasmata archaeon]
MGASSYGPSYPSSAYWFSLIGGILILLYGLLEAGAAVAYRSQYESILPGLSSIAIVLGALGGVLGIGIVLLALRLKSSPSTARTSGILIVVLSLLSFVGGAGLFIGLLLGLIGGILAWTWHPPATAPPVYGAAGTVPWQSSASPPLQPGVPQRFCPSCGSPNVATAQFCAKCGAQMAPP